MKTALEKRILRIEKIMAGWNAESILYCNCADWQNMTMQEAMDSETTGLVPFGDDTDDKGRYTYVDAIDLAYNVMTDCEMDEAILCRDYDEDYQRNAQDAYGLITWGLDNDAAASPVTTEERLEAQENLKKLEQIIIAQEKFEKIWEGE